LFVTCPVCPVPGVSVPNGHRSVHCVAEDDDRAAQQFQRIVEKAFGVGIGEEEGPGLAGVGGFVEAAEGAFAAGHDDGGLGVEGLDATEVEVVGVGRSGAALPGLAVVGGAEDGAGCSGGPGDSLPDVVDAAEVGGGGGRLDLPLGVCGGGKIKCECGY
jgi:hypothetical protein